MLFKFLKGRRTSTRRSGKHKSLKYGVLRELGRGSYTVVYLGIDHETKDKVAIKILKPEYRSRPDHQNKRWYFQNEPVVLERLNHPNVVGLVDSGDFIFLGSGLDEHKGPYFVLEHFDSVSLDELIPTSGYLTIKFVIDIMIEVSKALQHTHKKRVIHRDVAPKNVLVARDEIELRVKLIDFGFAKQIGVAGISEGSNVVGTIHYIAPERIHHLPYDQISDVYSLGVVLYRLLTNVVPFNARSALEIAIMHVNDPVPGLNTHRTADYPTDVELLVLDMLQKDPSRRPNINQVLRRLIKIRSRI